MRNLTKRVVVSSHAFSVLWPAGALPPLLEYPPTALWELSRKWDERKVGPTRGLEGGLCLVATIGKERKTVRGNGFMQVPYTHPTHPPSFQYVPFEKLCHRWRDIVVLVIGELKGECVFLFFFSFLYRFLSRSFERSNVTLDPSIRWNLSVDSFSHERTCVRKVSLRQIDSSRRDS